MVGVGLLAVAGIVAGPPAAGGPPFDPRSTAPAGLAALVEVLQELDRQVDIALEPLEDTDIVFLPVDRLDQAGRDRLRTWVDRGGTLVLGDLGSPLGGDVEVTAGPLGAQLAPVELDADCDLVPAADAPPAQLVAATTIVAGPGVTGCFPVGGGFVVTVRPQGDGRLILLADPAAWVNARLGDGGNAVLAAAALAPGQGSRVVVADVPAPGQGDRSLLELVPARVRSAGVLALVAVVLFGIASGRRLGQPVTERMPLRVPGSQLVLGVAGLLQRGGHHAAAAERLRQDAAREIGSDCGLPPDSPRVAVRAAARTRGIDAGLVESALGDVPVDSERDLVTVAAAVAAIRHARR